MQKIIKTIEKEQKVKVLFACESGSRTYKWNKLDGSSDYDLRFIYIKPLCFYLSVDQRKSQTIEGTYAWRDGKVIDYSGWELRKALGLLSKSNPNLIEQIFSPILYHNRFTCHQEELKELITYYFNPLAAYWHYRNLAKSQHIDRINEDSPNYLSLKKLLLEVRARLFLKELCETGLDYTNNFSYKGVEFLAEKYMTLQNASAFLNLVDNLKQGDSVTKNALYYSRRHDIELWADRQNKRKPSPPLPSKRRPSKKLDKYLMSKVISNQGGF